MAAVRVPEQLRALMSAVAQPDGAGGWGWWPGAGAGCASLLLHSGALAESAVPLAF